MAGLNIELQQANRCQTAASNKSLAASVNLMAGQVV